MPPFDPDKADENNVQVNRNFLEGPNLMTQARRQWNNAMLKPGNYFTVTLDSGPTHKRTTWGHIITRNLNRQLKRCPAQGVQVRGTGAQVMLHGIGPVCFDNRRNPIPTVIPISSVMIPSETLNDFTNLEYFAVFREWTPAQLYGMTHGPKVDPGWNMDLVQRKWIEVKEQVQKQPNATAFQYMPERIEELVKQDLGFWGSDAVPTVDVWDFFFREHEDGRGWYRRTILDWGVSEFDAQKPPVWRNAFLYTSDKRKYADSLSQIMHCQFGDCSAVAPFTYHATRGLGWMLWGVCDLLNRVRCRLSEAVFEQLMWFFRTANEQEFNRIKKAMFTHLGVIPSGIAFVTAEERFKPDNNFITSYVDQSRQLLAESAAAYTPEGQRTDKEMTATETMALVNQSNALVSGILNLAYEQERYKQIEQCRRFCIPNSPYLMVRQFRADCLRDGVPVEMLDHQRWVAEPERVLGGGNKTLEIAQANQLLSMRKNVGPDAQRKIDHIALEVFTDDPALAEDLAPMKDLKKISPSEHDAQLSTDRILRGLPYQASPEMVPEDYVKVWLGDMGRIIMQINQTGGMATQEQIVGLSNLAKHIHDQLDAMASNKDDHDRVRQYGHVLGQLSNFVKAYQQRLQKAQQAAARKNGHGAGIDPKDAAKVTGMKMIAQAKAANLRESHAQRTAQKQADFELKLQREEREHRTDLARTGQEHALDLAGRMAMGPFER